jgi:replication factor A1
VLGKITAVSNAALVRDTSGELLMRRIIQLQDHKYDCKLQSSHFYKMLHLFLNVIPILISSN